MACDRTILVPDATAIVQDQDGNELARENIASGATGIIPVNTGSGVLYTYPYDSFNTGQDVSYAEGDDKWVRDNVFIPEINSWDTNLKWVFPVLSQTDPTKLASGSNPDGSGTNIFGNLERFTDTVGTQVYSNDLVIDHFTGMYINKTKINTEYSSWSNSIIAANTITLGGKSGFHLPNVREYESLMRRHLQFAMGYSPFNYNTSLSPSFVTTIDNPYTSTSKFNGLSAYVFINRFNSTSNPEIVDTSYIQATNKSFTKHIGFVFRKAFTYNSNTKQMELT